MKMIIESYSPKETENLAASLVDGATPGAVFALSEHLGRKTIFAKGMAEDLE